MEIDGHIIELQRKNCIVDTPQGTILAVLKGALARKGRVYVGDRVQLILDTETPGKGTISRVLPRTSVIHRPAIANIDLIVAVATLRHPQLDLETLDKCLFNAEVNGVRALIVFNKIDILDRSQTIELQEVASKYEGIGYRCLFSSAHTGEGIETIARECTGMTSALSGLSGVGKSKIMTRLFPEKDFVTGEISLRAERGTHTTTSTSLLKLSPETYIADTPGFSLVELPRIPHPMTGIYFKEMAPLVGKCRFNNCLHLSEPGCAVKEQVEQGHIAEHRYRHYSAFLADLRRHEERRFS